MSEPTLPIVEKLRQQLRASVRPCGPCCISYNGALMALLSVAREVSMTDTALAFMLETGKLNASYTIPMILHCPQCGERHIDEEAFAEVAHHTHACQGCGFVWRPAKVNTHGVRFLPGYSNAEGV